MALVLTEQPRFRTIQCGYCASRITINRSHCQWTEDRHNERVLCDFEEVAWYRGQMAVFKHGKGCCNFCIQPNQSWRKRRGNNIENFAKFNTCEGCIVTTYVAPAPPVTTYVAPAPPVGYPPQTQPPPGLQVGAAAAAAPAPPPPPPPLSLEQVLVLLRNMEEKVSVLQVEVQELR